MATLLNPSRRPTVVVEPDMRFATSFLSTKYRDQAVPGEAIMDKTTGELYFKREDGKVMSFHQNAKMIHDLALELRILLVNNNDFVYPKENEDAYYVYTNYDLVAMRDETLIDMGTEDVDLTASEGQELEKINEMKFKVSGKTNGFFINHGTRFSDRAFIEYATHVYNTLKDYSGEDPESSEARSKFSEEANWEQSNYSMTYSVTAHLMASGTKEAETVTYDDQKVNLRLNESCAVLFTPSLKSDEETDEKYVEYYEVNIKSFSYPKLQYVVKHKPDDEELAEELESYEKFIAADGRIEPTTISVMTFVDNDKQVEFNGNELIVAFMDIPYINNYMAKMSKIEGKGGSFFLSHRRPVDEDEWDSRGIWGEEIREQKQNGEVEYYDTETNIHELEMYFAHAGEVHEVLIKQNEENEVDLVLDLSPVEEE